MSNGIICKLLKPKLRESRKDDHDTRELLIHKIAATTPFEPVPASSGNEAIQILKQRTDFYGIISDYNMPDGTGQDLQDYLAQENIKIYLLFYTSEESLPINQNHKFYVGKVAKPNITDAIAELIVRILRQPGISACN